MIQAFTKRELVVVTISLLLVIGTAAYAATLQQKLQSKERIIEANSALLREEAVDTNETANYIETICAEYRKLYQSYREARYPDPSSVDKHIGLPGSAKGQIDECYLPD